MRRKVPTSASTPPFSCASPGVQNSELNRQWERNATKRAVSSRREPRNIRFTAELRFVVAEPLEDPTKILKGVFVGFQKRLLGGMQVGPVECARRWPCSA